MQLLIDGSEPMIDTVARGLATVPCRSAMALIAPRASPFEIRTEYNPERRTVQIVPALIGVILNMTMVIFTAAAIVRERERGNLELLITTPIRSRRADGGKLLPYIFIGLIQTTLVLVVGVLDLRRAGQRRSAAPVCRGGSVHRRDTDATDLLISTVTKAQFQAFQLAFFTMLPSILLSGFMFPFDRMPKFAQWIAQLLHSRISSR